MKNFEEHYYNYKLNTVKYYIRKAQDKNDLYNAVKGLSFDDIKNDKELIVMFNTKAESLGVDEDKLFSWLDY